MPRQTPVTEASDARPGVFANEQLALGERTSGVYEVLREWIVSGELAPGEDVSQLELTRRLGVSRTPLREALRLLTRDGLVVETEAHRRVKISALSMADLDEVYTLRLPAATLALWHTVPRLTVSDLVELRKDLELVSSDELLIARDAHRRLHAGWAKYAGPRIQEALLGFMLHSERYHRAFIRETKSGRKAKELEHRAILRACEAGDREHARKLLVDHMASTALVLMREHKYEPVLLRSAMRMSLESELDHAG